MEEIYSILPIGDELRKFSIPKNAFLYYKNYRLNLLNGERENFSLRELDERLKLINFQTPHLKPIVLHFFYEWGFYYNGLEDLIEEQDILAIELYYSIDEAYELSEINEEIGLELLSRPSFSSYEESFNNGYQALLEGDCYQFNLTCPYQFKLKEKVDEEQLVNKLFSLKASRGSFAHFTHLGPLGKSFLSNSPECLFQIEFKGDRLFLESKPIKGSIALDNEEGWQKKWEELSSSVKDETELSIITDLLRNDLSRIEKPIAQVKEVRAPLMVPGILHQYSLIQVELSKSISLGQVMRGLFPGGSVTGAPKSRVLKILRNLEKRTRGFYCGSTVLLYGGELAGSINIRSAEFDNEEKTLSYQAGGGVTLLSQAGLEFEEMELKTASFMGLLDDNALRENPPC